MPVNPAYAEPEKGGYVKLTNLRSDLDPGKGNLDSPRTPPSNPRTISVRDETSEFNFEQHKCNHQDAFHPFDVLFIFVRKELERPFSKQELNKFVHPKGLEKIRRDGGSSPAGKGKGRRQAMEHVKSTEQVAELLNAEHEIDVMQLFRATFPEDNFYTKELRFDTPLDDNHVLLGVAWKDDALCKFAQDVFYPRQLSHRCLQERLGITYEGDHEHGRLNPPAWIDFRIELHKQDVYMRSDLHTGYNELDHEHHEDSGTRSRAACELHDRWADWAVFDTKDRQRLMTQYTSHILNLKECHRADLLRCILRPHQWPRQQQMLKSMSWRTLMDPRFFVCNRIRPYGSIEPVKAYFGSRIALYFKFAEFCYIMAMRFWGIGLLCCIGGATITEYYAAVLEAHPDTAGAHAASDLYQSWFKGHDVSMGPIAFEWARILFCLPCCLSASIFTRSWQSNQFEYEISWGVSAVESLAEDVLHASPEQLVAERSHMDHAEWILVPDPVLQWRRRIIAHLCDVLYLTVSIGLVLFTYLHAGSLEERPKWISTAISIEVLLINKIWEAFLAPLITKMEIHQYEHEYDLAEDFRINYVSLIMYMSQFIYIIVYQSWNRKGCLQLVMVLQRTNLFIYFLDTSLDLLFPKMTYYSNLLMQDRQARRHKQSPLASEFFMSAYSGEEFSNDYRELTIPVCTTMLLGVCDPLLTPLLLVMIVAFNMYIDMDKILCDFQRPAVIEAYGIGWSREAIFYPMALAAPATNWFLFSQHVWHEWGFSDYDTTHALAVFSTGGMVLLNLVWFFQVYRPVHPRTNVLSRRHKWQLQRIHEVLRDEPAASSSAASA